MNTKNKIGRVRIVRILIFLCMLFLVPTLLDAQIDPKAPALTRGRMWFDPSYYGSWVSYPGYFGVHEQNHLTHIMGEVWVREIWTKSGLNDWRKDGHLEARVGDVANPNEEYPVPWRVIKNHNFSITLNEPEEYSLNEFLMLPGTENKFKVKVSTKKMVWSLPKYDDFIITRQVFTNVDTVSVTDYYIIELLYGLASSGGAALGFSNDLEYIWAPDLRTYTDEQGSFIFFDDTSIPASTPDQPVRYSIPPGDLTGDRGDPGNIRQANSIDYQLYSPQVYAYTVVDCTPNKLGEKKVRKHIFVNPFDPAAPDEEKLLWDYHDYNLIRPFILREQTRKSWRDARNDPSTTDGNIWERTPQHGFSIGPYDLAPGDSIVIIKLACAGEMDRNITMLGGLRATQNFLQAGIDSLKKNWEAALYLLQNNLRPDAYPPPTPANNPMVGNTDELRVQAFVDIENGFQGFDISWKAIPDSYVDPMKGSNDLAGYRIYKSEQSVLGPWVQIDDLTKAEAGALIKDGFVVYRAKTKVGIPTRFAVTSYDDGGLESGMTGYTFFADAARAAPSNDVSRVRVVPNPFKQVTGLRDRAEEKRLVFLNIPSKCTIKIFTIAGELVQTIAHDDGFGSEAWGSSTRNDYMGSRFQQNVAPGVYIYHIESHVSGHEGESARGKFVIIK